MNKFGLGLYLDKKRFEQNPKSEFREIWKEILQLLRSWYSQGYVPKDVDFTLKKMKGLIPIKKIEEAPENYIYVELPIRGDVNSNKSKINEEIVK